MPVELLLPRVKAPVPPPPTYQRLNLAFGVGAGASLYDKSRYRSHGAITTATWAAGVHGYCLDFVQANPDYVAIPAAHTQLNFTTERFSFVIRVIIDVFGATRMFFSRGVWNAHGYHVYLDNSDRLNVGTFQALAAQYSRTAVNSLVVATWYTLGVSRNGASIRLYINGVDSTIAVGVHIDPLTSPSVAGIGIHSDLVSNPFDGKIEFLRIFGGIALQASEHLAWHNALA